MAAFHPEGQSNLIGDNSALHLTGSVQGTQPLLAAFGQFIEHFAFEKREILTELVEENFAAIRSRLVSPIQSSKRESFQHRVLGPLQISGRQIIELVEFAQHAVKAIIS